MKDRKEVVETPSKATLMALAAPKGRARISAVPDSIVNLRAELVAATDVLTPQVNGLHYLSRFATLPGLATEEGNQIVVFERRKDLIQAVITALDLLVEDGYPDELTDILDASLFVELQSEVAAIQAAAAIFQKNVAENLQVTFNQPVPKE